MVLIIKNDDALSSTRKLILIFAILILAYIVLSFFGMGVNFTNPTKLLSMKVWQPTTDKISVTYGGGKDAATFIGANVSIEKGPTSTATGWTWTYGEANGLGQLGSTIGSTTTATSAPGTSWVDPKDHVVVIGWFSDVGERVLWDGYL
jgi:hypothetical protein